MVLMDAKGPLPQAVNMPACVDAEAPVPGPAKQHSREILTMASRRSLEWLMDSQLARARVPVAGKAWSSARIAIKAEGAIVLIDPMEIVAAEAQGNYVRIFHGHGSHLLRAQLSQVADRLRAYGLIRIHRSVLVNADQVESVKPLFTGEYLLRLRGGREYNVTRTYKKNLQALAQIWLGTEGFEAG
jgi:DNA-binding LytR/AlgR family response regulator